MPETDRALIRVHAEWDGWRSAEVRFADLRGVHWFQPHRARQPLVHAYVSCTDLLAGDIIHDCSAASTPHRLLVCVLKKHTIPAVYAELARLADERAAHPGRGRGADGRNDAPRNTPMSDEVGPPVSPG